MWEKNPDCFLEAMFFPRGKSSLTLIPTLTEEAVTLGRDSTDQQKEKYSQVGGSHPPVIAPPGDSETGSQLENEPEGWRCGCVAVLAEPA